MRRALTGMLAGAWVTLAACSKEGSPEQVADAFADAYFRRMDQEKAKEYTALGATAMLEAELREVEAVRRDGAASRDAPPEVTLRRGEPATRDHRVRIPYEIRVGSDGAEVVRDADVELTHIQGAWKVVRVSVKSR